MAKKNKTTSNPTLPLSPGSFDSTKPPFLLPSQTWPTSHSTEATEAETISGRWKWLALAFIGFHLVAVFVEPFRFFSRSNVQVAPDAEFARNLIHPYSQFLFLDHGYFFFAPNPGPGHLIRILASPDPVPSIPDERRTTPLRVVKSLDGSNSKIIQLPDRNTHTPRLLYHRYFMLSEFYYGMFAPPELGEELRSNSEIEQNWKRDRGLYVELKDSLHQYGKRVSGLDFTRVDRVERELPNAESILKDKVSISDPRWQYVLPESFANNAGPSPQSPPLPTLPGRPNGNRPASTSRNASRPGDAPQLNHPGDRPQSQQSSGVDFTEGEIIPSPQR